VHWYEVSGADSIVVYDSDGRSVLRDRDPRLFRAMLLDTARQHARLARHFRRTKRRFRAAWHELTGTAEWREQFRLTDPVTRDAAGAGVATGGSAAGLDGDDRPAEAVAE
jgi:hypothetical protein